MVREPCARFVSEWQSLSSRSDGLKWPLDHTGSLRASGRGWVSAEGWRHGGWANHCRTVIYTTEQGLFISQSLEDPGEGPEYSTLCVSVAGAAWFRTCILAVLKLAG